MNYRHAKRGSANQRGQRPKTLTRIKFQAAPPKPATFNCPGCGAHQVRAELCVIQIRFPREVEQFLAGGQPLVMCEGVICEQCARPVWSDGENGGAPTLDLLQGAAQKVRDKNAPAAAENKPDGDPKPEG